MSRLLLGFVAAVLAFVVTENSASAQMYQRFVPAYSYGYSSGYYAAPQVHVVPGAGTHYHAVPHGNHIDLVPHGNNYHGHSGHNHGNSSYYSPYGRSSFSFGYSSGYGGGFGMNYSNGYNRGHCW